MEKATPKNTNFLKMALDKVDNFWIDLYFKAIDKLVTSQAPQINFSMNIDFSVIRKGNGVNLTASAEGAVDNVICRFEDFIK